MTRHRKNYFIYLLMLLLFGGLIYVAIREGESFDGLHVTTATASARNAWNMFCSNITESLSGGLVMLLVQIVVVLFAVRVFSYLFRYIGQPGVIGEIVAGIVLGSSLLGYFFSEVFGWLFRPESLTNLELISQLGLILFMFVIGMELDFGVIRNKINETLAISHAGILVPFFLGIIASYWVYEEYASSQTAFLPFSLFIGISMSITAFPVLARIIQERNMTQTSVGILSIASAANDGVTAWCLLAVVIAVAKAGTVISALSAVGLTLLYLLVMFLLVRPFLCKVGEVYATSEVINKTFVSFIFLVLIVSATLTEFIGIHSLFGAFMAGVVMSPNIGFRKVMMEKVEDVALVFFLPLFFAYTGLHTEIGLIDTPQLWILCGLFILVAVLGKSEQARLMLWGSKGGVVDAPSGLLQRLKLNSYQMVGTLFREKTYNIIEEITYSVGIFVNRLEDHLPQRIAFLLGGECDRFLIPYLNMVLEAKEILFNSSAYLTDEWKKRMIERTETVWYDSLAQLRFEKDTLLVLSYEVSKKLAMEFPEVEEVPSLLIMKNGQ